MSTSKLAKPAWFLLFLAIAAFYAYGLGVIPLVGPDEPRYAEVAREMFMRRDFITPTLGGIPWFEKPPLLYWLMMASYRVFGVNEAAARLGPALCGLAAGYFVYWTARNLDTARSGKEDSEFARWSALVFLSSLGAIVFSRGASFDIVLTMTLTGALACFFVWDVRHRDISSKRKSVRLLVAFYFFLGLSLLAKGLVGPVITAVVIGAYYLLRREWPSGALLRSFRWGIVIVLLVAGTWYGPMIYRHGWIFFNQFIVQHHFARFFTNKYHHPQPFYFYIPILVLLTLPWTLFLLGSISSMRFRELRDDSPRSRLRMFSFIVLVAVVALFSFSGSKLPAYILPALPAAAWIVGDRLDVFRREKRGDVLNRFTGILSLLFAGGALWSLSRFAWLPKGCVIVGATACAAVGLFGVSFPQKKVAAFLLFACCSMGTIGLAIQCSAPIASRESVRDLLRLGAERGFGSTPLVGLHTVERSAEFYASGMLVYGADGEPVKFEGAPDVVAAARQTGGTILCLVPLEYESQLTTYSGAQTEVIGNNGQVSLVIVRAR